MKSLPQLFIIGTFLFMAAQISAQCPDIDIIRNQFVGDTWFLQAIDNSTPKKEVLQMTWIVQDGITQNPEMISSSNYNLIVPYKFDCKMLYKVRVNITYREGENHSISCYETTPWYYPCGVHDVKGTKIELPSNTTFKY